MKRVVIVGAGVVGLFCALRLAQAGARVTVLEAEPDDLSVHRPAASAAAAGMLAPFDSAGSPHEPVALASFDLWRSLSRGAPWEAGVRFDGGVHAFASEADAAALQARVMQSGRAVTPLSRRAAQARTGFHGLEHGVFIGDEGVADPVSVMAALAHEARQRGVQLLYERDVRFAASTRVTTHGDEVYEADHVVLAPGAWATEHLQAAAPALKHVRGARGHLVQVSAPAALRANLHAPGFYLARRNADVVLGATMEFDRFERRVDPAQVALLLRAGEALLGGQVRAEGRAWVGIRPMSPDGWPMVGPDATGVLLAAGHSRNGWVLAPITAEIIRAYVFDDEIPPAWAALSPTRFSA